MTIYTLEKDLKDATVSLIQMSRDHSWNKISSICSYILTEIVFYPEKNYFELGKLRKQNNEKKIQKSIDQIILELKNIYLNIYEIDLLIYKAKAEQTIVEIQYILKSSLERDYLEDVKDDEPKLHCKVAIPPYADSKKNKFDINWELGGLRHEWKMFCGRISIREKMKKR